MPVADFYPKLPILPYKKTTVKMADVIEYIQSLKLNKEIKRAVYVVFRIESANGQSGVQNNYIGLQSDSGKWPDNLDKYFVGVCIKNENQTGKERGFLCFSKWQDSVDILVDRLSARGIFIGGTTHKITNMPVTTPEGLATAYQREWVKGSAKYIPLDAEIKNFVSMYNQASKIFT